MFHTFFRFRRQTHKLFLRSVVLHFFRQTWFLLLTFLKFFLLNFRLPPTSHCEILAWNNLEKNLQPQSKVHVSCILFQFRNANSWIQASNCSQFSFACIVIASSAKSEHSLSCYLVVSIWRLKKVFGACEYLALNIIRFQTWHFPFCKNYKHGHRKHFFQGGPLADFSTGNQNIFPVGGKKWKKFIFSSRS